MMYNIKLNGITVSYELQYKKVKNINLRIKSDGKIYVSASKRVPYAVIEGFLKEKADFILKAKEKYERISDVPKKEYFSENEIKEVICEICMEVYPYFEKLGIDYPKIKFRKMTSRWGSCQTQKKILTFNTNLRFAPLECIRYVVLHEFTHFLQANHSPKFYDELSKTCPLWKNYRKQLKEILITK